MAKRAFLLIKFLRKSFIQKTKVEVLPNEPHIHKVQNPGHIKGGLRAYKLHNHFPISTFFTKAKKAGMHWKKSLK